MHGCCGCKKWINNNDKFLKTEKYNYYHIECFNKMREKVNRDKDLVEFAKKYNESTDQYLDELINRYEGGVENFI